MKGLLDFEIIVVNRKQRRNLDSIPSLIFEKFKSDVDVPE